MLEFIKNAFKGTKKEEIKALLAQNALIIDVRMPYEFQGGHVAGSKNIPLGDLSKQIGVIKKLNKPVVLCCASGMRSAQATSILKAKGLDCINGGSWTSINALT